jgi:murein DD-endopeptidase MepM/ murein hydrolase activator NlpD
LAEPADDGDDDISSLLAPRFRRNKPASAPAAPPDAPAEEISPHGAPIPATVPPSIPDDLPVVSAPTRPVTPIDTTPEAATAIVGNERFLPIAEPALVRPTEPGPMRIFAPIGTAVHTIEAGRVAEIDEHIAGEITIRVDGDRFYRYRRLLPSSVCVDAGEHVSPGSIIGTVGDAIDDDPPCLVVGLQSGEGDWADLFTELIGIPDPGELGLCVQASTREWFDPLA